MSTEEKDYRLVIRVTPEQEKFLRDNGITVLDREEDIIWDSVMSKDRLSVLVETTLGYYIDEELFSNNLIPKAKLVLNNQKLFDTYVDAVFEAYKQNYFDSLGLTYDESDSFIAEHFGNYIDKHPEFLREANQSKKAPAR